MFNDFNDFDNVLDRVTSNDDTIVGLLDEDDFKLVKSNVTVSNDDFDKDDMDLNSASSDGFDPSEFADPDESKSVIEPPSVVIPIGGYKNKMAHARAIYDREATKGPIIRKNVVALFQSEVDCSAACASTYFQTIKNSRK